MRTHSDRDAPEVERCEPCGYLGIENAADHLTGTDFTPTCGFHTTHSWTQRPPAPGRKDDGRRAPTALGSFCDPRIKWHRIGYLVLSPRAYLTHSLSWTGMGWRHRCWSKATYPVRQWAYKRIVRPSRLAQKVLG